MNISIIVAADERGAIGSHGNIPWHLQADLKRFKELTMGHFIVVGRKTFESIGKPLPGRTNIIVSNTPDYRVEGGLVVHSLEEAIRACSETPHPASMPIFSAANRPSLLKILPSIFSSGWTPFARKSRHVATEAGSRIGSGLAEGEEEVFVIGGGQIYRLAMPVAETIYLTRVHGTFKGDVFFPEIDKNEWNLVDSEFHAKDEKNSVDFTYLTYKRKTVE